MIDYNMTEQKMIEAFEKMLALVCHICYNIKGLNTNIQNTHAWRAQHCAPPRGKGEDER